MLETDVKVTVPGDVQSVRVLRVVVADAAASADLGFDRYSDLELAVSEASTVLLDHAVSPVVCVVSQRPGSVSVQLSGPAADPAMTPDADGLSGLVLEAVTDELSMVFERGQATIEFLVGTAHTA